MSDISKQQILDALAENNNERARSARRLGISPPTFSKLVSLHGIELPPSPHHHSHPKEYYQAALDECLGQVAATARYLGISAPTLRKHLHRHKLGVYSDD